MLILNCTVILVTPTSRHPSHTGYRQRVEHYFVRTLTRKIYDDGSQTDGLYTHHGCSGTGCARSGGSRLAALSRRRLAGAWIVGKYACCLPRGPDRFGTLAGGAGQRAAQGHTH